MSKNKYCCPRRNEDGVALVFALSMLALLLIMLIGFLATSLLEQRIAFAVSENNSSRLLARGALVRITGQLENSADDLLWMRNRSADANLIAPVVSIADDGDLKQATNDSAEDNGEGGDAYQALKPLLRKYFGGEYEDFTPAEVKKDWHWRNFFPDGEKVDYPQWIYYYNNPDKEIITGRVAYVIIPNLGIDPTLPGKGDDPQIGVEYPELDLKAFLTANGITAVKNYDNYISMDWLLSKYGVYGNNSFNFAKVQADFYSEYIGATDGKGAKSANTNEAYREFAELYFTTGQEISEERDYQGNSRTFFDYSNAKNFADCQTFINNIKLEPAGVRNQVAANLCDYMDADSEPTSDRPATGWVNLGTNIHPTYTGNEKTPYINQIIPAVQLKAEYDVTTSNLPWPLNNYRLVTQNVTIEPGAKVFVELINIYPEDLTSGRVVLKNVEIALRITASAGTLLNGNPTIEAATLNVSNNITVSKNGYAVVEAELNSNLLDQTTIVNINTINRNAAIPTITVTAQVTRMKFDRAVLLGSDGNAGIDYVEGMQVEGLPRNITGTSAVVDQATGETNEWRFNETSVTKTAGAYADFAVADPRCNLQASEWTKDWLVTNKAVSREAIAGTWALNAKNRNVTAQNTDITKEMDLEPNEDPAKLTNAYIRNGAMNSPWELGFIHRGVKWQTINLKSTIVPGQSGSDTLTYLNDGMLWDLLKFRNEENGDKFNINYLARHQGAFALLLQNLKYHPVDPVMNSYTISESSHTETLTGNAEKELRSWIANKCYKAAGSKPESDASKVYPRYISRAQLANVITDWALNGTHSPFRDKLSDMHIEEIIGKIAPLTRCGDSYEYFTAFVVAQSVKDIKGVIYKYDNDGNISGKKEGLEHGTKVESEVNSDGITEVYYDKITSTTYLVARMRREVVSCEDSDNCRNGVHKPTCKFKVVILESHTLSEP